MVSRCNVVVGVGGGGVICSVVLGGSICWFYLLDWFGGVFL